MPNVVIFPASLARSVAQSVASANVGAKGQAGCATVAAAIGSNWRLRIRNGSTAVVDAVTQTALAPVNGVITLPQYSTLSAMIAGTVGAGWTVRIGRADDSVYVEGGVGLAGSGQPFVLTADPGSGKGLAVGALTLRFDPAVDGQVEWLQALRDSMTVRSVTERIDNGQGVMVIEAQDGSQIPFPDSYATMVSYDTIAASLSGQPTGSPGGDPMFFANGYDGFVIWGWFGAKRGHASTQSSIRVSDMGAAVLRKSTGQWVIPFRGMRGLGYLYPYLNAPGQWAVGQDTGTDPYATYLAPVNGQTIEVWPLRTPASLPSYSDFTGLISRELYADMAAWTIVLKVRVEGPDRALSRFIGCIGCDIFRSDHAGRRYWPTGLPQYVADAGGSEWQNIRNDGQDQWIVAPGCFELGNFQGNRPPWGNWGGRWPYADPPRALNWAGFQANPPPDLRV